MCLTFVMDNRGASRTAIFCARKDAGIALIAFGALERGAGTVIFADVSSDLLALCRDRARDLDVLPRCQFVQTPADVSTRSPTPASTSSPLGRC